MEFSQQQLDDWKAYEHVRKSGSFNMITEARMASAAAGLTRERYFFAAINYMALRRAALADLEGK